MKLKNIIDNLLGKIFKIPVNPLTDFCDVWNLDDLQKRGVKFPYPYGIVIHEYAKIGNNCTIYQNVTLGAKCVSLEDTIGVPTIKDNVIIYPNAVIVGGITVGENSIIGAGSVVLKDVPPNSVVAGCPAKVIKQIGK